MPANIQQSPQQQAQTVQQNMYQAPTSLQAPNPAPITTPSYEPYQEPINYSFAQEPQNNYNSNSQYSTYQESSPADISNNTANAQNNSAPQKKDFIDKITSLFF